MTSTSLPNKGLFWRYPFPEEHSYAEYNAEENKWYVYYHDILVRMSFWEKQENMMISKIRCFFEEQHYY